MVVASPLHNSLQGFSFLKYMNAGPEEEHGSEANDTHGGGYDGPSNALGQSRGEAGGGHVASKLQPQPPSNSSGVESSQSTFKGTDNGNPVSNLLFSEIIADTPTEATQPRSKSNHCMGASGTVVYPNEIETASSRRVFAYARVTLGDPENPRSVVVPISLFFSSSSLFLSSDAPKNAVQWQGNLTEHNMDHLKYSECLFLA